MQLYRVTSFDFFPVRFRMSIRPMVTLVMAFSDSCSVFTISGNYTFKFDFYNDHSYNYGHGNIYLLVEPIPEPSTLCLAVFGLIGLASRAWWRRPWK